MFRLKKIIGLNHSQLNQTNLHQFNIPTLQVSSKVDLLRHCSGCVILLSLCSNPDIEVGLEHDLGT